MFATTMPFAFAQTWFPIGATWYRDYSHGGVMYDEEYNPIPNSHFTISQYHKYEVIKDTIVNDLSAKLILKTFHKVDGSIEIVGSLIFREENNQVFYYDYSTFGLGEADKNFHLMYDFNLKVGDTLDIELPIFFEEDEHRHVVLAAITTEEFGEIPLKVQHFVLYDQNGISEFWKHDTIKITEKLIHSCTMFPLSNATIAPVSDNIYCNCAVMEGESCNLRCYIDNQISYHANENIACDTVFDSRTGIEELLANDKIKVSYNEALTTWNIENSEEVVSVEVVDILGKTLTKIWNQDKRNSIEIDLSKYNFGTYFLKIHTNNKQYFHKINKY